MQIMVLMMPKKLSIYCFSTKHGGIYFHLSFVLKGLGLNHVRNG